MTTQEFSNHISNFAKLLQTNPRKRFQRVLEQSKPDKAELCWVIKTAFERDESIPVQIQANVIKGILFGLK